MFKFDIQHFAEEETQGAEGQGANAANDNLSWEAVQSFLEQNADAQQYMQSRIDQEKRSAVEAFKANTMPDLIKSEVAKAQTTDPMQQQLNDLKAQIDSEKQARTKSDIVAELSVQAGELNISTDIAKDFCVADNLENSTEKLKRLDQYINEQVDKRTDEELQKKFAVNYKNTEQQAPVSSQSNTQNNQTSLGIIQQQLQGK